jgi:hypothetical protein
LQELYTIIHTWHEARGIIFKISETTIELHLPKHSLTYAEFTHELLRIYLKAIEGIYMTEYLILKWNEKPLMGWFFNSPDVFEIIGRKLEDTRIYLFFSSNEMPVNISCNDQACINYYLKFLQQSHSGRWSAPAVSMFLKSFFSINVTSFLNDENLVHLEKLKSLNQNLFSISNAFYQSWKQLDVGSTPSKQKYKESADNFISALFSWALRNVKLPSLQSQHFSNPTD